MNQVHYTKSTLVAIALILVTGNGFGFSFDFGDDDDEWWHYAYRGNPNQPWIAPNGRIFYPRLPYFQRQRMVDRRQAQMVYRRNAMNELHAMLYRRGGFDRAQAIKMARGIEATAGHALADDFHPGAIATYDSNTTLALWGNPDAFRAKALTLQAAAAALAEELAKKPTPEKGGLLITARPQSRDDKPTQVTVSPDVWERFNDLTRQCDSCHQGYRGYGWW